MSTAVAVSKVPVRSYKTVFDRAFLGISPAGFVNPAVFCDPRVGDGAPIFFSTYYYYYCIWTSFFLKIFRTVCIGVRRFAVRHVAVRFPSVFLRARVLCTLWQCSSVVGGYIFVSLTTSNMQPGPLLCGGGGGFPNVPKQLLVSLFWPLTAVFSHFSHGRPYFALYLGVLVKRKRVGA